MRTVAEECLSKIAVEGKRSTYIKYRNTYELYISPFLADKDISEINASILEEVLAKNSMRSSSTLNSIRTVLKHIFSFSETHYGIQMPGIKTVKGRKKMKQPVSIPFAEQVKLLTYLEKNMEKSLLGIYICFFTGIRLGEICSLKWTDIDLKAKVMYINTTVLRIAVEGGDTKTALLETEPKSSSSKRKIPIPERLLKVMHVFKDEGIYVLAANKPMEPRRYENIWKDCLKRAGIPYRNFHCLRHTFATNCVESGIDAKSLSEILGHSDVRITLNRYVHPSMETKKNQMEHMVTFITDNSYEGSEKWS